jgi:hypothetical protein
MKMSPIIIHALEMIFLIYSEGESDVGKEKRKIED